MTVPQLIQAARAAQRQNAAYTQAQRFALAQAVAWAVMDPARNRELSEQAVAETGFGRVEHKIAKNHRKTLGLLRDLQHARTTGVIAEYPDLGITEYARPLGVVAALVPSTNPVATPVNKIINALVCGNAIIVAPSPKGAAVFQRLLGYIHQQLDKLHAPRELVQALPIPPNKAQTQALMHAADWIVATGSQNNVRAAYSSGTPAIGVGAGNVTAIIDETANCARAAEQIAKSKTFDNATSCSCENNVVIVEAVWQPFIAALEAQGGQRLTAEEQTRLVQTLWPDGRLAANLIAKDAETLCHAANIQPRPGCRFLLAEPELSAETPLTHERMTPILSLFRAADFAAAARQAEALLNIQGAGHSLGLHSASDERARSLAMRLPVCRIIINQAHCFATGGSFDNGLPFSLSMGCGSWGGNSIADNLNHRHYMNITRIARPITPQEPSVEDMLGDYLAKHPD